MFNFLILQTVYVKNKIVLSLKLKALSREVGTVVNSEVGHETVAVVSEYNY